MTTTVTPVLTELEMFSFMMCWVSIVAYANRRWLKFTPAVGVTVISSIMAVSYTLFNKMVPFSTTDYLTGIVKSIDFNNFLLHGILSFLLFAGAIKVEMSAIKKWLGPISLLATFGVLISAFTIGFLLWGAASLMGINLPFLWACLFGALISPTDPIAALAIVKSINAPKHLEMKLVGESLFNDGTGVVAFITILAVILGTEQTVATVSLMLVRELVGGLALGGMVGYCIYKLLKTTDDHSVILLLTLAAASVSYSLAEILHMSAPISTVAAGLVIGNKLRDKIEESSEELLHKFWDFIDEVLNSCLFALIGLEVLILDLSWQMVALGFVAFVCTIFGRFISVGIPLLPYRKRLLKGTVPVITWGGMRGGISLALALSIPFSNEHTSILLTITFVTVMLSSLCQGLTLKHVIQHYHKPKAAKATPPAKAVVENANTIPENDKF